jgi:NADH dehydrogenase
MKSVPKVVIIGGGFGGLCAARTLKDADVEITLIDRCNFHLFQPLLYQVATGLLSTSEIITPLRHILKKQKNCRVLMAEAVDIDPKTKRIILADGVLTYDTLIVAAGMQTNFFGHNEWAEHATGLKTMEDASAIRQKLFYAFEVAEREVDPDKRKAWLTFAVIGAGSTGIELAGMIAEICYNTIKGEFHTITPEDTSVLLIEAVPRLLPAFPSDLSQKAEKALQKLRVTPLTNARVTAIDAEGLNIVTPNGDKRIHTHTIIWSSGVQTCNFAASLAERTNTQTDKQGRLKVNRDLTLPDHPDIFVIGDMAHFPGHDGYPLPGVAPVATQQGRFAARTIKARLQGKTYKPSFHYFDKGMLSVIGRHAAVAKIGSLRFSGFFAWLLWLFIHLALLINFENRLIVMTRWAFQYFIFSRGGRQLCGTGETKLPITGTDGG